MTRDREPSSSPVEQVAWDQEVEVRVVVRVRVRSDPDAFEGLQGRTVEQLAAQMVYAAGRSTQQMDGWADFKGDVDVVDVHV